MLGTVGRDSGELRLSVCHNVTRAELEPKVLEATTPGAVVNTDECSAYDRLPEHGRGHAAVCHSAGKREWARDDDGDGIREVHNNTMEGIWTGLRNFLRTFRGVHKKYLQQYVAVFQWVYNLKQAAVEFLRVLVGLRRTASESG